MVRNIILLRNVRQFLMNNSKIVGTDTKLHLAIQAKKRQIVALKMTKKNKIARIRLTPLMIRLPENKPPHAQLLWRFLQKSQQRNTENFGSVEEHNGAKKLIH